MEIKPPPALRQTPSSHLSALWWLGLLYRRPTRFRKALEVLPKKKQALVGFGLYLHFLPYFFLISALSRVLIFGVLGIEMDPVMGLEGWWGHAAALAQAAALALAYGIAGGIAVGIAGGIAFGIAGGIAGGIAFGIAGGIAFGIAGGIAVGIAGGIAEGLNKGKAPRIGFGIAFGIAGGIAGGIAVGIAVGIAFGIAFGIASTRAYYWPFHLPFVFPAVQGHWYPWHPVAWDDLCSIPFPGFPRLLVAYAEQSPEAGEAEIERLIDTYPAQRPAALEALTTLILREAGRQEDLSKVNEILASLPEGEKGYLAQTKDARLLVQAVTIEAARLEAADRPFLREPAARAVVTEIKDLKAKVAGFHEPLATELRKAADQWLERAQARLEDERRAQARAPVHQPFRAGDPVDAQREAFVERLSVIGEIEQQVRLAEGSPGLILCGRRRTGKSTVLRNLPQFLPSRFDIARLSLQDAKVFTSQRDFCFAVGHEILSVAPPVLGDEPTDLPSLMDLLNRVDEVLTEKQRRLIVALDEYEGIDVKIGEGVFSVDLLATLRESIQRHRRIVWMLTGVHEITELPHAPWSSYLVSARLVEVPLFTAAETRLLLTEPMKQSDLWRDREEERPRFEPGFWGEDGIERIQAETGGWPHLVQLVAEMVVDLINREQLPHATPELLDQALDKSVVRGHAVFYELMRRECRLEGEWEYLEGFRKADHLPPPEDPDLLRSLQRRLLVTPEDNHLRLRVPLMGRWLRARG